VELNRRIIFVTTPHLDPWSGAEELWSRTAIDLVSQGFPVSASVWGGSLQHPRMRELRACRVELWPRPSWYSWHKHPWRRLKSRHSNQVAIEVDRLIAARPPALVVLSDGGAFPPIQLLELCVAKRLPFVTIEHANTEAFWYTDELAERHRKAITPALRCFFVSEANRRIAKKQIGGDLTNAEIIRNPFNVPYDRPPPWPPLAEGGGLRFACVGRLWPPSKGQDILFEAFSGPVWEKRQWCLYIYGEGPVQEGLKRLGQELGIADRIVFAGFSNVEEIWVANHVLVMPSRYEGLPIAMVEAMLCSRPVIATDVAGHAEIVEDGVTGFLADAPTARSMAAALERFWERRDDAESMGNAAARRIRQLVPADPVRLFSEKLKALAGLGAVH
jgi:glycosyltransferase involved in cell wall biosynthesis